MHMWYQRCPLYSFRYADYKTHLPFWIAPLAVCSFLWQTSHISWHLQNMGIPRTFQASFSQLQAMAFHVGTPLSRACPQWLSWNVEENPTVLFIRDLKSKPRRMLSNIVSCLGWQLTPLFKYICIIFNFLCFLLCSKPLFALKTKDSLGISFYNLECELGGVLPCSRAFFLFPFIWGLLNVLKTRFCLQVLFLGALRSLKLYIILNFFLPWLFFFTTNLHKSDNHMTEPTLVCFFLNHLWHWN